MSEVWNLSTTDGSNTGTAFGFPEGMNASDVNDRMRALSGALARQLFDLDGTLVSGGSGSAYTVASNRSLTTSYGDNLVIAMQMHAACATGATLNVGGKGAKQILKWGATTTLSASDILANQICVFSYETTLEKWQMVTPVSAVNRNTALGDLLAANNLSDVASAGSARSNLGLAIGSNVQAFDADILKADTDDTLTAGFGATLDADGTKSSGTYTPTYAGGNYKTATNGGAHTLAPQTADGSIVIQYTNDGSAGTITTSGFDIVTGDSLTTTNGHDFMFYLTVIGAFQHLHVTALQ